MIVDKIEIGESVGLRDYMEDTHYVSDLNKRFFCAFVFDGHGGVEASAFLKKNLPEALMQIPLDTTSFDIPLIIRRLIRDLHLFFVQKHKEQGSTICGALIDKLSNEMFVVNLGDSQLIMYGPQGKCLYTSSRDTTDDVAVRNKLEKMGIKVNRTGGVWRMEGVINLTKAFGDLGYSPELDAALKKLRAWDPKVEKVAITQKTTRVTIATDGLFDEIQAEFFPQIPFLRKIPVAELAEFIGKKGTKGDNVTIVNFDIILDKP